MFWRATQHTTELLTAWTTDKTEQAHDRQTEQHLCYAG